MLWQMPFCFGTTLHKITQYSFTILFFINALMEKVNMKRIQQTKFSLTTIKKKKTTRPNNQLYFKMLMWWWFIPQIKLTMKLKNNSYEIRLVTFLSSGTIRQNKVISGVHTNKCCWLNSRSLWLFHKLNNKIKRNDKTDITKHGTLA